MIRGFVVCGEIGQACPVKCGMPEHDGKLLTFPSPTPPPPLLPPQTLGIGSIGRNSFFSSTASTQPNTTKDICTGTPCADLGIFCQGGSRLLNLFYSLKRGSNGFVAHFPGGGGLSNFFQGWGSNRHPYNYNL